MEHNVLKVFSDPPYSSYPVVIQQLLIRQICWGGGERLLLADRRQGFNL